MERLNRLGQFDALRAWAIVGVIAIHASAPFLADMYRNGLDSTPAFWVLAVMNQAGRFSVPAFFLLAGFFTTYRRRDFEDLSNVVAYVRKRGARILIPYMAWSFIFYVLPEIANNTFRVQTILLNLTLGWTFNGGYFLVALAQLTILGPILIHLRKSGKRFLTGGMVFSLVISETVFYFGIYGQTYLARVMRAGSTAVLSTFVPWSFFYLLGLIYGLDYDTWNRHLESYRKWLALLIPIALTFSVLELRHILTNSQSVGLAAGFFKFTSLLLALAVCGYILGTNMGRQRTNQLIPFVAENSFAIYLIHGGVIQALSGLSFFAQHLLAGQIVLISAGLIVPIAIYQFSKHQLPTWVQIAAFGSARTDDTQTLDKNVVQS